MSKFTVFLIHGIGIHKDSSWADQAIEMLRLAWQRDICITAGPGDATATFEDYIEVVPISYDEVFEDYLDDFADLGKAVLQHQGLDMSISERQRLAQTLATHKVTDRNFIWSHIVDVILYKMSLVREQVNVLVAQQLYARICQGSTRDNFGIIAHSLGTRVISDTLQRIRTEQADQANFYKQGYKLKFLMQISDVTDLFGLPFHHDPCPPKNVYPRDTYDYFRTVSNCFDPIARMVPTSLKHWPIGRQTEKYLGRLIYRDILLDHVHETNVHGLTHYMLHPEITDEIFRLCGFGRFLSPERPTRQQFPNVGPHVQPELGNALKSLMSNSLAMTDNSWQTYINLVIKFCEFTGSHDHHDHRGADGWQMDA